VTTVAEVRGVTKTYGGFTALDAVSVELRENTIHGLLGRNGAGKTTLMRVLTGQTFPDAGQVRLFAEAPTENERVLEHVCFVSENQPYPDHFQVRHVLQAAALLFPKWDAEYAAALIDDFALPPRRKVSKLSRGMRSALGIVVGLASRAPLTLFDEPYLGLDAVARQLFYDRLLADYAENPRTILLSTHLIDEVGDLLERVTVIESGRILVDDEAESLRSRAVTVSGPTAAVASFTEGREVLHVERMASFSRATVADARRADDADLARRLGVDLEPVSLQDLVVRTTNAAGRSGTGTAGSTGRTNDHSGNESNESNESSEGALR
jgi:ABC-2 type transport system ATP-binding protein